MAWTERYVRADAAGSGDGTTNTNSGANGAWTLAEAITNVAAGHRVNILAGTYANTTTSRTFNTAGTTTAPIWIRGFNTVIGDCDLDPTLSRPEITFTTGGFTASGAHYILSSLNFSADARTAGPTLTVSGGQTRLFRCRSVGTNANAAANALTISSGTNVTIDSCYFSASTTATRCVATNVATSRLILCNIVGGVSNVDSSNTLNLIECLLRDAGSDAILQTTNGGQLFVHGCTIRNPGRDGIRVGGAAAVLTYGEVADCVFAVVGGYGINNVAAAGNTNTLFRINNRFYSCTSGNETGLGDSPSWGELTGGSDPHVSSTNLALATGDAARGEAFVFENLTTTTSYDDRGAVQHQEAGGTGGIKFQPGFTGGFQRSN